MDSNITSSPFIILFTVEKVRPPLCNSSVFLEFVFLFSVIVLKLNISLQPDKQDKTV